MTSYAQTTKMNQEVKDMILLGKDSIVQLALELMNGSISMVNFSQIKAMTDGRRVYVSFRNPIKYLPMKSVFYVDLSVDLLEEVTSYSQVSNGGFKLQKKIPFYKETEETKMNILFIIEAINKSDEIGSIDMANFEDDMIIREAKNHYFVNIVSEFQESSYKIEKVSGKVYDSEHTHLAPTPFQNEKEYILKEIN